MDPASPSALSVQNGPVHKRTASNQGFRFHTGPSTRQAALEPTRLTPLSSCSDRPICRRKNTKNRKRTCERGQQRRWGRLASGPCCHCTRWLLCAALECEGEQGMPPRPHAPSALLPQPPPLALTWVYTLLCVAWQMASARQPRTMRLPGAYCGSLVWASFMAEFRSRTLALGGE